MDGPPRRDGRTPHDSPEPRNRPRPGALLHLTLDDVRTSAIVLDDDGAIVAANDAALRMLGRSLVELVGEDFHDLLHRDDHGHTMPRTSCPLRRALLEGSTSHGDTGRFVLGDGSLVLLSWVVTPYALGDTRQG
jgi:PAS domain S-box-containing protein